MDSQTTLSERPLVLAVAVIMGSFLASGCDLVVNPRIDVYEGKKPGYQVKQVEELKSLKASPIKGAKVWLMGGGDLKLADNSSGPGTYNTHFRKPWVRRDEIKQIQVKFKCTKDGYSTVEGSFTLGAFMGEDEKTVLVRMKPIEDEAKEESGGDAGDAGNEK